MLVFLAMLFWPHSINKKFVFLISRLHHVSFLLTIFIIFSKLWCWVEVITKTIIMAMDLSLCRGASLGQEFLIVQLKSRNYYLCHLNNMSHLQIQTPVTCNLQVWFRPIPCLIGLYSKICCFADSCKPPAIWSRYNIQEE